MLLLQQQHSLCICFPQGTCSKSRGRALRGAGCLLSLPRMVFGNENMQQWQILCAESGVELGGAPGLVLEGMSSSCSKCWVSPCSLSPSQTSEMNEIQRCHDVTARGEMLRIKKEQEVEKAARFSAWVCHSSCSEAAREAVRWHKSCRRNGNHAGG